MITLTADQIIQIGKDNLAKNVCDLGMNELYGLPECKGNSWNKEFLRWLILDAYDKCLGKKATTTINIPFITINGIESAPTFPMSYNRAVDFATIPFPPFSVVYLEIETGIFPPVNPPPPPPQIPLQEIVDKINDPIIGGGFSADIIASDGFSITLKFSAPVGALYNKSTFAFDWYSAPGSLNELWSGSRQNVLAGGADPICPLNQQTIDCYYSVLNS